VDGEAYYKLTSGYKPTDVNIGPLHACLMGVCSHSRVTLLIDAGARIDNNVIYMLDNNVKSGPDKDKILRSVRARVLDILLPASDTEPQPLPLPVSGGHISLYNIIAHYAY